MCLNRGWKSHIKCIKVFWIWPPPFDCGEQPFEWVVRQAECSLHTNEWVCRAVGPCHVECETMIGPCCDCLNVKMITASPVINHWQGKVTCVIYLNIMTPRFLFLYPGILPLKNLRPRRRLTCYFSEVERVLSPGGIVASRALPQNTALWPFGLVFTESIPSFWSWPFSFNSFTKFLHAWLLMRLMGHWILPLFSPRLVVCGYGNGCQIYISMVN